MFSRNIKRTKRLKKKSFVDPEYIFFHFPDKTPYKHRNNTFINCNIVFQNVFGEYQMKAMRIMDVKHESAIKHYIFFKNSCF